MSGPAIRMAGGGGDRGRGDRKGRGPSRTHIPGLTGRVNSDSQATPELTTAQARGSSRLRFYAAPFSPGTDSSLHCKDAHPEMAVGYLQGQERAYPCAACPKGQLAAPEGLGSGLFLMLLASCFPVVTRDPTPWHRRGPERPPLSPSPGLEPTDVAKPHVTSVLDIVQQGEARIPAPLQREDGMREGRRVTGGPLCRKVNPEPDNSLLGGSWATRQRPASAPQDEGGPVTSVSFLKPYSSA